MKCVVLNINHQTVHVKLKLPQLKPVPAQGSCSEGAMYGHWHLLQFFTLPSAPHSYSLDSDPLGVWGQARRAVLRAWWIFILIKYLFMCPRNSESPPGSLLLHVPEQR